MALIEIEILLNFFYVFIKKLFLVFIIIIDRFYTIISIYRTLFVIYKVVTHKLTGKSYLERIIRYNKSLFIIDNSLFMSKQLSCNELKEFFKGDDVDLILEIIIKRKKIKDLKFSLKIILLQIQKTYIYKNKLEKETKIVVDFSKEKHFELLNSLWTKLEKTITPNNPSPKWKIIGFQGNNPLTDFRGMGLFGLLQLVEITNKYEKEFMEIYKLSKTKEHEFPFCIVGINISYLLYRSLEQRKLQRYFYKTQKDLSFLYFKTFLMFSNEWKNTEKKNLLYLGIIMKNSWNKIKKEYFT